MGLVVEPIQEGCAEGGLHEDLVPFRKKGHTFSRVASPCHEKPDVSTGHIRRGAGVRRVVSLVYPTTVDKSLWQGKLKKGEQEVIPLLSRY